MEKQRKLHSLTIVAPFYNEEDGAEIFYGNLCEHLDTLDVPYNFVFVDDGSRDGTLKALNHLADHDPRVTVLSFSRNFGHQIALTAGLDYAEGEAIIVMDSDLQHPPASIRHMIARYEAGSEVVYAVRSNDNNRGFLKRFVAQQYYRFLQQATTLPFIPGAVDFRLMSQDVLKTLQTMRETHRYLRGMVPWVGFEYDVIYYEQQPRLVGASQYTWRKLWRMARHGLFSFSTIPLDLITALGVLMTFLALIYLIYIFIVTITIGAVIPGWTSSIVVSLLIGGVQLISLGVIAQYVGMIFEQVKGRPLYVLKQKRIQSVLHPKPDEQPERTIIEG